jgi:hypothetical protein
MLFLLHSGAAAPYARRAAVFFNVNPILPGPLLPGLVLPVRCCPAWYCRSIAARPGAAQSCFNLKTCISVL